MRVKAKGRKYIKWHKKHSGKDYYTGEHYIEPNLKEHIDRETDIYGALNRVSPIIVHKPNGESYVEFFDGRIISYENYKNNYLDENGWLKKEVWERLYCNAYEKGLIL